MERGIRVWIIDDDEINTYVCKRFLNAHEKVSSVESLLSATESLARIGQGLDSPRESLPNLIILDVNMPAMNAWDFMPQFRALMEKIPSEYHPKILLITSSLNEEDQEAAREAPEILGFLSKPITSQLVDKIFTNYYPSQPEAG